jgi:predicted RecA/RadA family phage recombinase
MSNYVQPGEVITLTAPVGGVVSGQLYIIGSLAVVATTTAAAGAAFEARTVGVHKVKKLAGSAWSEGEKIYLDVGTGVCQDVLIASAFVGNATVAALAGDTVGYVRLSGAGQP